MGKVKPGIGLPGFFQLLRSSKSVLRFDMSTEDVVEYIRGARRPNCKELEG